MSNKLREDLEYREKYSRDARIALILLTALEEFANEENWCEVECGDFWSDQLFEGDKDVVKEAIAKAEQV